MKQTEKWPKAADPSNKEPSRRKFLRSAAVTGAAVATLPIAGIAQYAPEVNRTSPEDPLEQTLSRYGSELGNLKRIS